MDETNKGLQDRSAERDPRGGTRSRAYHAGVAVTLLTSLVMAWTTLVHDDGNGLGYLLTVVAAAVGAFAAGLQPAGMARAMLGVAIMQMLLAIALATDPSIARVPTGSLKALAIGGLFAVLWLIAAMLFRVAARDACEADQRIS